MGKKIDLNGQRFGKLVVLSEIAERDKNKKVLWSCVCDCGKKTEVTANRLRRGHTKSCGCAWSENLEGKRYGRLLVIARTNKRSGTRVIWDCLCDCGIYCTVNTTLLNSGKTKSCGCLRLGQVGENHPSYNPNLTDEERLKNRYRMSDGDFRSWANLIKERDNYTCQVCGDNKSGNLNAHHLNGWNTFPEQRFDLDNGVTLCTDCHKDFHSQYGYGDNTREQFDEYAASKTLVLN